MRSSHGAVVRPGGRPPRRGTERRSRADETVRAASPAEGLLPGVLESLRAARGELATGSGPRLAAVAPRRAGR